MCTSLEYKDAAGRAYVGRTLELTVDLPYQIVHFPVGYETVSQVPGHPPLTLAGKHAMLTVSMPDRRPTRDAPIGLADLKVLEGLNDRGLTFSVLSYPAAAGPHQQPADATRAALSASDLGAWVLGQFASVAEVKAALVSQPVVLQPIGLLGGVVSPFHYVMHDRAGAALVIEFDHGQMNVYDNPVGVTTNGPRFDWHLTNLGNYTFLANVDKPTATFGSYHAAQPDSGIAMAGLPASNTSVGRFVRAAYYAQFTEKAATPDQAVRTLAHILNNFDRPRGATIDYPDTDVSHLEVQGLGSSEAEPFATEFTCWTSLSDLERTSLYIRDYESLNFTRFDLAGLAGVGTPIAIPLKTLASGPLDGTDLLRAEA